MKSRRNLIIFIAEAAPALVDEIPQIYLVMKSNKNIPQLNELGKEGIINTIFSILMTNKLLPILSRAPS